MTATTLLQILVAALVFGVGGTYVVRKLALRLGVVDHPGERKVHLKPIPLLGGVAIFVAFVGSLVLLTDLFYISQLISILIGGLLFALLGLWDDQRSLTPIVKFVAQVVVTVGLILSGVQIHLFDEPLIDLPVTALWVLGITNALNLLDNMDGLSSGVGGVAAAFFLLLAVINGQILVGALAAALLGACVGFLVFNFNPARIFMGDAGSLFIGFMLAAIGIKLRFPGRFDWVTWMVPVLVLGLPIFDVALVTVSRLRRGVPIWQAGRDHVSHRLAARGWTTREVAFFLYLVGGALGMMATMVLYLTPKAAYALLGFVGVLVGLGGWYLERMLRTPSGAAKEG